VAAGFPLFTDNHIRQQIQRHHRRMTDGEFIAALVELASSPDRFAYRVQYIKPGD
jgi:hypothetical protein